MCDPIVVILLKMQPHVNPVVKMYWEVTTPRFLNVHILVSVLYAVCVLLECTVALKIQNFAKSVWVVILICIHV